MVAQGFDQVFGGLSIQKAVQGVEGNGVQPGVYPAELREMMRMHLSTIDVPAQGAEQTKLLDTMLMRLELFLMTQKQPPRDSLAGDASAATAQQQSSTAAVQVGPVRQAMARHLQECILCHVLGFVRRSTEMLNVAGKTATQLLRESDR